MMDLSQKIAIIGCSISGLTTANVLRRLGYKHVHVYDRVPAIDNVGYNQSGIIIAANGVRLLDRLGLAGQLYSSGSPISTVIQRKVSGARLASYTPASVVAERMRSTPPSATAGKLRPGITSIACWSHILINLLYEQLPPQSIHWEQQLTKVNVREQYNTQTKDTEQVLQLYFNNQEAAAQQTDGTSSSSNPLQQTARRRAPNEYDLLIGCDGVDSYVRRDLLEGGRRLGWRELGGSWVSGVTDVSTLQGLAVTEHWKQQRGHCVELWGNGIRLIHTYISSTHIFWHLSLASSLAAYPSDAQTSEASSLLLKKALNAFGTPVRTLLEQADAATMQSGVLRDRVPSGRFASDDAAIAVAGEAQHPMLIDGYQKVAMCIEDAFAFGLSLAEGSTNKQALSRYGDLRFGRINHLGNFAHANQSQAIERGAFMSAIRDWATSMIPSQGQHIDLEGQLGYNIMKKFSSSF